MTIHHKKNTYYNRTKHYITTLNNAPIIFANASFLSGSIFLELREISFGNSAFRDGSFKVGTTVFSYFQKEFSFHILYQQSQKDTHLLIADRFCLPMFLSANESLPSGAYKGFGAYQ